MNLLQRVGVALLGKGLYELHPELRDRQHLFSLRSGELGSVLDDDTDLYEANVWVRRAVTVLADNIAPLPVRVVDRELQPRDAHPVTELLEYANDAMAPSDLWREWTINMCLDGECGFELARGDRGFFEVAEQRIIEALAAPQQLTLGVK